MYRIINAETARDVLYSSYDYEQINGNQLRATDPDGSQLRLVFPVSLPLNGRGHPFAPGCCCAELTHHHEIFRELQFDSCHIYDVTIDTGNFRHNENGDPEFEYTAPCYATDICLIISWGGEHPPVMCGRDCDFARKFSAEYFERSNPEKNEIEAGLTTSGVDLWIVPKHEIFAESCDMVTREMRKDIAAGEVFYATESLVRPVYRDYMEKVTFRQLREVNPTFTTEFQSEYVDVLKYRDALDGKLTGARTQIGRFPYTLQGAQEFAALAAEYGVIQSPPHVDH